MLQLFLFGIYLVVHIKTDQITWRDAVLWMAGRVTYLPGN